MKLKTLAMAGLLSLGATLTAGSALAQQRVTVNIGSSHPTSNIWAWAMKDVFQPEVDKALKAGGNKYEIRWRENYGGTLYKFTDTRAAVRDGIVDVGMVGTVWESSAMPLQNVTYFTPFATTNHEMLIEIFDKLNAGAGASRQLGGPEHGAAVLADRRQNRHLRHVPGDRPPEPAERRQRTGHIGQLAARHRRHPVDGALTTY
jgi:TRAP-type C4-dicarboxylate transport system substrate-binding protein